MELDIFLIAGFAGVALLYILMNAAEKARSHHEKTNSGIRGTDTQTEFREFKKRTAEDPKNPKHWVEWGDALANGARQAKNTSIQLHRYNEACACYAHAIKVAHNYIPAWVSWGVVLYELFRVQQCSDALLLEGGHCKFRAALALAPKAPSLWKQWGNELAKVASSTSGSQRCSLLELAHECFESLKDLSPGDAEKLEPPPPLCNEEQFSGQRLNPEKD